MAIVDVEERNSAACDVKFLGGLATGAESADKIGKISPFFREEAA